MRLDQLLGIDRTRRVAHEIHARLRLGECDHIANIVGAHDVHDQSIESERDSAVRRSAVLERVEEEAELHLRIGLGQADQAEHRLLDLGVVDTNRAAGDLAAVEH